MTATTLPRGYDDRLGLPVVVGARRPAPVAGEPGDAISMPAAFGALVLAELEIMMLAGPVVADADGSWTFPTGPANTLSPAVPADLLALGVRLLPPGTRVVRPSSDGSSWIVPPAAGREPAIWSVVVGAARRVADRARRTSPPAPGVSAR
jgi:hypothetical protein